MKKILFMLACMLLFIGCELEPIPNSRQDRQNQVNESIKNNGLVTIVTNKFAISNGVNNSVINVTEYQLSDSTKCISTTYRDGISTICNWKK
jgi:hypothetical protein